jgi:hypothetical protein
MSWVITFAACASRIYSSNLYCAIVVIFITQSWTCPVGFASHVPESRIPGASNPTFWRILAQLNDWPGVLDRRLDQTREEVVDSVKPEDRGALDVVRDLVLKTAPFLFVPCMTGRGY